MIYNKNYIGGSKFWLDSSNLSFQEIQKGSNVTYKWLLFDEEYNDKIIKPVNKYASYFSTKPEVVINNDSVILRQKTHSEIWVQPMSKFLYAVDKVMQRQFYPSEKKFVKNNECFLSLYKFYTPWILDHNLECDVVQVDESPFYINTNKIIFNKLFSTEFIEPQWVHFYIKKTGTHMVNNKYGIIPIGSPMFDIIIKDKDIGEKIIEQFR